MVKESGKAEKGPHHKYNHVDLVQLLGIADLDAGTKVAGARGFFLKGAGVLLNQALINCGLQFAVKRGYEPLQTPFFMRKSIMAECAQLSQFDEELYHVRYAFELSLHLVPLPSHAIFRRLAAFAGSNSSVKDLCKVDAMH